MKGTVFSIEEFATFDGPGIRMTVFMKGCPLSCSWCHNPEGQSPQPELVRSPNGCIKCLACEKVSTRVNGRLMLTPASEVACPRNLIRKCGREYTVEELCSQILKNAAILNASGGGVTFSGGEPLYSSEFVFECIDALKGSVHTAIQTSGFADERVFTAALKKADYFLYDLKIIDERLHERYCGASNGIIIENYARLAASGVPFVTRVPLIPGVTDTAQNKEQLAQLMKNNGINYVEVLPYNKLAGSKYALALREYAPDFDDKAEVDFDFSAFDKCGVQVKIM